MHATLSSAAVLDLVSRLELQYFVLYILLLFCSILCFLLAFSENVYTLLPTFTDSVV